MGVFVRDVYLFGGEGRELWWCGCRGATFVGQAGELLLRCTDRVWGLDGIVWGGQQPLVAGGVRPADSGSSWECRHLAAL